MNRKQKKTLFTALGLLAALAILLVIVVIWNHAKTKKEAASAASSAETLTGEAEYTAMTWTNSTATISLAKNDKGAWYWTNDPDFPLDATYPQAILTDLTDLTPQQTITDGDGLEAYGLDAPAVTLKTTDADGGETTFSFGNATTDGTSYYLLVGGDESTVYIVDGALHDALSKGIYDMMALPDLPELTDDDLVSIQVSGAADTQLTAERESADADSSADSSAASSGSGETVWRLNGVDVSANASVTALVSAVEGLKLTACADYKPTDAAAALCGLAKPAATLTAVYTDSVGAEQTWTLSVGGASADGKGYYVRVSGDSTVYTMSSDTLSAVLQTAQSGLS